MNYQSLERLIQTFKDDPELLQAIQDALDSFEKYHAAIYSMETRKKILIHSADTQNYQEETRKKSRLWTENAPRATMPSWPMSVCSIEWLRWPASRRFTKASSQKINHIGGRLRTLCLNMCIRSFRIGPDSIVFHEQK